MQWYCIVLYQWRKRRHRGTLALVLFMWMSECVIFFGYLLLLSSCYLCLGRMTSTGLTGRQSRSSRCPSSRRNVAITP